MDVVDLPTTDEWRAWFIDNGASATEVWLVVHHKGSSAGSMRYHEAIEQALCFGWIDGLHHKHDATSSRLRFTPRGARSSWSALNRERAQRMISAGLMTERGQAMIDLAKSTGTWEVLTADQIAATEDDLYRALLRNPSARKHFDGFPPSSRRLIVEWIARSKRPATRDRRMTRTIDLAAVGVRANH